MLAKHDTPINARRTVLGFVPARLNNLVIMTRSIFDLLNAEAIVKPPIRSMIVGVNICEKTNLQERQYMRFGQDDAHSLRGFLCLQTSTWLLLRDKDTENNEK